MPPADHRGTGRGAADRALLAAAGQHRLRQQCGYLPGRYAGAFAGQRARRSGLRDSGFCTQGMIAELERRGLHYILAAALRSPVRTLCRHDVRRGRRPRSTGSSFRTSRMTASGLVVLRPRRWPSVRRPAGNNSLRCRLQVPGAADQVAGQLAYPRSLAPV